jgi:leucyl-tRNA synthetase
LKNFSYNKIIANFHEVYSALNKIILHKIEKKQLIENYKKILISINPVIPHFSNECMEMINIKEKILWPKVDEKFLFEDNIKFIIPN